MRWMAVLAVILAACGVDDDPSAAGPSGVSTDDPVREHNSEECLEERGGFFYWDQPGCEPAALIDVDAIISGGPPPDGIPPIDNPVYESVEAAAEWLTDGSPVMVVDVDDNVRAYPLAILTWHEIVNDTVGGVPLVITYCPLCNSALVFESIAEGPDGEEMVLDFGTSGRLFQSNLVMYDRQTLNLWTQFEGLAVVGESFLGTELTRVPAWLFGFGELAELHPDAQVLSRDTGFDRDYGRNPYAQYDQVDRAPFLFRDEIDDRFGPMERVVGLLDEEKTAAVAVVLEGLADNRVIEVEVGGDPRVVLWAPGQASALDTVRIDEGREVGQTAAYVPMIDDEPVELEPADEDGRFVDARTGSTFDLRGRALDGPLEGERLQPVTHDDTFWFVWIAFKPDTEVVAP